jgi:hypothetical protein
VEKARSAPIISALRAPFGSTRMRLECPNERMRVACLLRTNGKAMVTAAF